MGSTRSQRHLAQTWLCLRRHRPLISKERILPQSDTPMHRSSTSFQNTDRECDPSGLVCQNSVRKNLVCPDLVRKDLVRLTAFPTPYTPGLRHITAAKDVKQPLTFPRPQGIETADIFRDTLIESGLRSKRNTWATVGSLAFPLFFLVTLVVAPFYFTDPLPKREVVTMLYV